MWLGTPRCVIRICGYSSLLITSVNSSFHLIAEKNMVLWHRLPDEIKQANQENFRKRLENLIF